MAKKKIVQKSNMTLTDSKGKVLRAPKEDSSDPKRFKWWEANNDVEMAYQIAGTVRFLANHQGARWEQLLNCTRLYGNASTNMMGGAVFARSQAATGSPSSQRLSYNVIASVIDTLTNKVAKNKVVPTFITQGGNWSMQMRAKKLTKFADGIFYQTDAHEKVTYCFRDAGVWGRGFLNPYRIGKDIYLDRVYPHEILEDYIEASQGKPREIHRVQVMDRDVAKARWPEYADELETIQPVSVTEVQGYATVADMITVIHSYHLKSSENSDDGYFAISCGDLILDQGEWKYDYFPYPCLYYSKRIIGEDGQGAAERLSSIQTEINKGMLTIQRAHWLLAGPKVAISNTSKIVKQHLNNELGTIITHTEGQPPQYLTPPIMQPEVYEWIKWLIQSAYEQEGVSEMSAASKKPAEELSGIALRSLNDMESERFMFIQQQVEQFALEIIDMFIDLATEIAEENDGHYETMFAAANFTETIDWKDINLKKDEYVLKAYPTSSLPNDPSARLQTIVEQMQAGLISPRQGRRLMSTEDIEMSDKLANAAEDLMCKWIEEIIEDGADHQPTQFNDLTLAKQLSLQYMNYAMLHDCPEKNIAKLQTFISLIDDITMQAQPQPMPQATPMANPQPTPTSPLVPNVNQGVTQ